MTGGGSTAGAGDGEGGAGAADAGGTAEGAAATEATRRRRRTEKYCTMWGIRLAATAAPEVRTVIAHEVRIRNVPEVRRRALVELVLGLKGQGLTQHEVFAFADAYELWEAFTIDENELILEPDPSPQELVQAVWRFERANVYGWALQKVRHLHFADYAVEAGVLMEKLLPQLVPTDVTLRSEKDLLDNADVHLLFGAICRGARLAGDDMPANLHDGVVYERELAFEWLLGSTE